MKTMGNYPMVMALGEIKFIDSDGALVAGSEASAVMITSEDDLEELAGLVQPGSIAFTAGMTDAWQLGADGTWTQWLGGE